MSDKEFMWALKNGDLDEVKDYVAKVGGGGGDGLGWARRRLRAEEGGMCSEPSGLQGPPFGGRPGGAAGVAGTATCLRTGSVGTWRGGEGPGLPRPLPLLPASPPAALSLPGLPPFLTRRPAPLLRFYVTT